MSSEIFKISKRLFLHDSLQCQGYQKLRENEVCTTWKTICTIDFSREKNVIQTKIFHHRNVCIKTYNQMRRDGGKRCGQGGHGFPYFAGIKENQKQRETIYVLLLAPQIFGPSAASELMAIIHKMPPEARIQVTRLSKISI